MKSALGQISGCLDTAWTVLGHVLGHAWFGLLACPEAARGVFGGNRGEGEAMLDGALEFSFTVLKQVSKVNIVSPLQCDKLKAVM